MPRLGGPRENGPISGVGCGAWRLTTASQLLVLEHREVNGVEVLCAPARRRLRLVRLIGAVRASQVATISAVRFSQSQGRCPISRTGRSR